MKVYEMYVKVYCVSNLSKNNILEQISKLIDTCLVENEIWKDYHLKLGYKYYSYSGLKPLEKDGQYKQGNIYTFVLRTCEEGLKEHFRIHLHKQYTSYFKVLTVEHKEIREQFIEKIYALTPMILKFDTGYWRGHYSEEIFEKRLRENMIKKYNLLNAIKIDEDFELFNYIRFDNQKPVAFHYKDIILLGDKVTLGIATNQIAQSLAYLSIASGIGEMNSRGAGFIGYKYL